MGRGGIYENISNSVLCFANGSKDNEDVDVEIWKKCYQIELILLLGQYVTVFQEELIAITECVGFLDLMICSHSKVSTDLQYNI